MAPGHDLPVLRDLRLQLHLQHDLHVSLLPDARRKLLPGPVGRLPHDVHLRQRLHDRLRLLRQPLVLGYDGTEALWGAVAQSFCVKMGWERGGAA